MIATLTLDPQQREAIDADAKASLAIIGPAGSGKSTALQARAQRLREQLGGTIDVLTPPFATFARTAWEMLAPDAPARAMLDESQAYALFTEAAQPLLDLTWPELDGEIDPEVAGLRMPEFFFEAAFRLIGKLQDALVTPDAFLASALRGAATFTGKTPNLAHIDLITYTKAELRRSLDVDAVELTRQYRHEVALAKILAKLYREYLEALSARQATTPRDLATRLVERLNTAPEAAQRIRAAYPALLVDDAQSMTLAELHVLREIFGEALAGVTLAGDDRCALASLRGVRVDAALRVPATRISLHGSYRKPTHTFAARYSTQGQEAAALARCVQGWIAQGVAPERIAVAFRSVRNVDLYESALLDAEIATARIGDVNLFEQPTVLDALAPLWLLADPHRHDSLLRLLSGAAMKLSDASLASLCSPPSAQRSLFGPEAPRGKEDPQRKIRLGRNFCTGEMDEELEPLARERIVALRAARAAWIELQAQSSLPDLVLRVWHDALARSGEPNSARAMHQQGMLGLLHARISAFAQANPGATLLDFLQYAQDRAQSSYERVDARPTGSVVHLISVDALTGVEYSHLAVANVRPGAFPKWYVADTFSFSPSLGVVARDNVGDARTSRTAKFMYYTFRTKARERYNEAETAAFAFALSRAAETLVVTAWDRPTSGRSAPELLETFRAAGGVRALIV